MKKELPKRGTLNELQNCILDTILVWSLFLLIRLYMGLHFLQFLLENLFFVFLFFLWINRLKYASSCNFILICNFVLTLYRNSLFINNKLFLKIIKYYVNAFKDIWVFENKLIYKEKHWHYLVFTWNRCGEYSTFRHLVEIYNMQKLSLCLKMDISKAVLIKVTYINFLFFDIRLLL